ncbi:GIY-YIG nuclease family protein [Aeromicrobium duanguangcaii]|uniref:GIY-YIG nuclease family protein n=1 Tax=Aeromicrobium duanguangcaii TaxID=2968086 RepID=UPI0020171F58|nr:GIY-YIG nuclease family protein [Aeromicrobium duanguangcaii]MCL3836867.1 GIY-YIG nuclease family protein [Aeromicrobium duanguangcaii]
MYEWNRAGRRRLLGERDGEVVDFSASRGIYLLHQGDEVYYVGHTINYGRFSGRLSDHAKLTGRHGGKWDSFSWFSFDGPGDRVDSSGHTQVDDDWDHYDLTITGAVKGLEAILIEMLAPPGNVRVEKHGDAERWEQVCAFDWNQ